MALNYQGRATVAQFSAGAVIARMTTNVPPDMPGVFKFYYANGLKPEFQTAWATGRDYIDMPLADVASVHKVMFFPFNGLGVWFHDAYSYSEENTLLTMVPPPGAEVTPTHQVSGACLRDGAPFAGEVHIVSAADQAHLAMVTANPSTGAWLAQVATAGAVYAFVAATYGRQFSPGLQVLVGDTIHPTAANGYTYQVTQAGTLGDTEPATWPTDAPLPTGTARLEPRAYPAPQVHGPINPALI